MKSCTISIITTIDGCESSVQKTGKARFAAVDSVVRYTDDEGEVALRLKDGVLTVSRRGGYTLFLELCEGEERRGRLGIGGEEGDISVFTKKLSYSVSDESCMLFARYVLHVGGEPQETTIRVRAALR